MKTKRTYYINNNVRYHNPESYTKKCPKCGSNKIKRIIIDNIEYNLCEIEFKCMNCDYIVDYWSYGFFDNNI